MRKTMALVAGLAAMVAGLACSCSKDEDGKEQEEWRTESKVVAGQVGSGNLRIARTLDHHYFYGEDGEVQSVKTSMWGEPFVFGKGMSSVSMKMDREMEAGVWHHIDIKYDKFRFNEQGYVVSFNFRRVYDKIVTEGKFSCSYNEDGTISLAKISESAMGNQSQKTIKYEYSNGKLLKIKSVSANDFSVIIDYLYDDEAVRNPLRMTCTAFTYVYRLSGSSALIFHSLYDLGYLGTRCAYLPSSMNVTNSIQGDLSAESKFTVPFKYSYREDGAIYDDEYGVYEYETHPVPPFEGVGR
ncbi:MAG: DUF4595 domain-containing protein [Prevotellaceae bacterium]|nr:DUF4595 domain-containing protein [Candidatus Minthosoma caballi]